MKPGLLTIALAQFLCFLSACAAEQEPAYDIVFVLHDAGESLGLQPVVDSLLKNDHQDLQISILCLGEPSTTIYEDYSQATTLQALGVTDVVIIDGTQEGREQLLSEEDMLIVQSQLPSSLVVCGMAYAMQAQLCSNILQSNSDGLISPPAYSMSFYDSFSLWSSTSVAATYFTNPTPEAVRAVMVSADEQLTSLTTQPDEVSPYCSISLTGNPTLESWAEEDANEDRKLQVRKLLYGDNNGNTVGIIFAGGYGGDEYTDSLNIFCSTAKHLCVDNNTTCLLANNTSPLPSSDIISDIVQKGDTSSVQFAFVFAPHPGYSSLVEAELFLEWGCSAYIRVLPEALTVSTAEVIVSSNVSVSQCSTVGGQSLSVGVAHAYLTSPNGCEDVFTASQLIPLASSAVELTYLLLESETFRGPNSDYYVDPSVLVAAGVPVNGTANILQEIKLHL